MQKTGELVEPGVLLIYSLDLVPLERVMAQGVSGHFLARRPSWLAHLPADQSIYAEPIVCCSECCATGTSLEEDHRMLQLKRHGQECLGLYVGSGTDFGHPGPGGSPATASSLRAVSLKGRQSPAEQGDVRGSTP